MTIDTLLILPSSSLVAALTGGRVWLTMQGRVYKVSHLTLYGVLLFPQMEFTESHYVGELLGHHNAALHGSLSRIVQVF